MLNICIIHQTQKQSWQQSESSYQMHAEKDWQVESIRMFAYAHETGHGQKKMIRQV